MRDLLLRALPLTALIVLSVVASVGAFAGGLWATLGIGLALILFFGVWAADKKLPLPPRRLALFMIGVLAFFAAELPLSFRPDLSPKVWLQLVTIFVPLLLLTAPRLQAAAFSKRLIPATALAAGIASVALGLELHSGGYLLHLVHKPTAPLTDYNRGVAHLSILAFPISAGLWVAGRKRAMLALALLLLIPASLTESHTAKLALLAGAFCAAVAFYLPRCVRYALTAAAIFIMGWPFYAQRMFALDRAQVEQWHGSWRHRMEIWDYLSYRIADRPLLGWGLGSTHSLDFRQPHGDLYQVVTDGAPHAHNFVTELWVETGIFGLACGLVFLLWSLRAAARLHPSLRPFALGGWAAAVTVSMFGFDFWTDALWAAFALSAFVFGMAQQQIERGDRVADI